MFKNKIHLNLLLVTSCFWLSGMAALIYQTAWLRRFSIIFGTSELAVAVVLSAYMAGLALGAVVAATFMAKITRPILFYGVLEGIIAGVALLFPVLLGGLSWLFTSLFGHTAQLSGEASLGQSLFFFIGAFVVILIPTTAMGATLPVLAKSVISRDSHIGGRIGLLYAMNTIGAVAGTLLTAFVLLPWLGLRGSVYCAVAVNLLVFVVAVVLERSGATATTPTPPATRHHAPVFVYGWRGVFLVAILVSGMVSFTYEVLWTRLLGHILGGSVAAFATMLASFLAGIGLGSLCGAVWARNSERAQVGFWICQLGIAVSAVAVYHGFDYLAAYSGLVSGWKVSLAMATMLPTTLFIGATFPLVVRIYASSATQAPAGAGIVYGWNTVGAIAGAAAAGFFLVPLLKYEGSVKLAVLVSLLIALLTAFAPALRRRRIAPALSALAVIGVALFYQPAPPLNILRSSPIGQPQPGDVLYYSVGRSATVLIQEHADRYFLRTNGLPEANTAARARTPHRRQSALMSLPALVRPQAKDVLVVGLGAGALLEDIPAGIERVDVIELEPRVVEANQFISTRRQTDPLSDQRVHIHIGDARGSLALTSQRWDIVISQPSHPWTAGASHLYTEEFMRSIDAHLNPDGVYLQWMNASYVSHELLASLVRALNNVFGYVRIYQVYPGVMYFLSSQSPIEPERDYHADGRTRLQDFNEYRRSGLSQYHRLFSTLLMNEQDTRRFSSQALPITDEHNYMATGSLRAQQRGQSLAYGERFEKLNLDFTPAIQDADWVKGYLTSNNDWKSLYYSLHYGRDEFYDLFADEQPPRLEYIKWQQSLNAEKNAEKNADYRADMASLAPDTPLPSTPATSATASSLAATTPVADSPAFVDAEINYMQLLNSAGGLKMATLEQMPKFVALSAIAQAAMQALLYMRDEQYSALAELDGVLSGAVPGELWYRDAARARVTWRIHAVRNRTPDWPLLAAQGRDFIEEFIIYGGYQGWQNDYLELTRVLDNPEATAAAAHAVAQNTITQLTEVWTVPFSGLGQGAVAYISERLDQASSALNELHLSGQVPSDSLTVLSRRTAGAGLYLQKMLLNKGNARTIPSPEPDADPTLGELIANPTPEH